MGLRYEGLTWSLDVPAIRELPETKAEIVCKEVQFLPLPQPRAEPRD